ncbi:hypothetical protein [Mycolicibacterium thermoresistibile]
MTVSDGAAAQHDGRVGRSFRVPTRRWRLLTVAALLITSTSLAAVLYGTQYRTVQQAGPASEQAAVEAASSGTVALLSYTPETLDDDLAAATSAMTGDFLTYYGRFTTDVVAPAVREKGIRANARVERAGLMEIGPGTAKVLVFLNQETSSSDRPEPALTASSVVVGLTDIDGRWLISAFDPV